MKTLNHRPNTILRRLLIPLTAVMLIQAVLFAGTILWGGTVSRLDQNAFDILEQRVTGRKNYLENEMVQHWSHIDNSVMTVNDKIQSFLQDRQIGYQDLTAANPQTTELLRSLSKNLIYLLRKNYVTDVFIVLDGGSDAQGALPGLYFRDLEPAAASESYSDLLVERGPSSIIKELDIPMDSWWTPQFTIDPADASAARFLPSPMARLWTTREQTGAIWAIGAVRLRCPIRM